LGISNQSQSLIDDIINSVNNLVYQGISSLEDGLTATPPARLGFKPSKAKPSPAEQGDASLDYPQAKQEIEEGLHQLETLLESTVDKNFDKFEIYVLRNILSVPEELASWIRLSHYEVCVDLWLLALSFGFWPTSQLIINV
jgi:kinetochore protein Mis12/MTW1